MTFSIAMSCFDFALTFAFFEGGAGDPTGDSSPSNMEETPELVAGTVAAEFPLPGCNPLERFWPVVTSEAEAGGWSEEVDGVCWGWLTSGVGGCPC